MLCILLQGLHKLSALSRRHGSCGRISGAVTCNVQKRTSEVIARENQTKTLAKISVRRGTVEICRLPVVMLSHRSR